MLVNEVNHTLPIFSASICLSSSIPEAETPALAHARDKRTRMAQKLSAEANAVRRAARLRNQRKPRPSITSVCGLLGCQYLDAFMRRRFADVSNRSRVVGDELYHSGLRVERTRHRGLA